MKVRGRLVEVIIVVALVAGIHELVIPELVGSRKHRNEVEALGTLQVIEAAQGTFRGRGLAGGRHGELRELIEAGLVDEELAGGERRGYAFAAGPSLATPDRGWWATASPVDPGATGDRSFALNHEGILFYTARVRLEPDPRTCALPPWALPVGKLAAIPGLSPREAR